MATIGRNKAVAEIQHHQDARGFVAWLMWLCGASPFDTRCAQQSHRAAQLDMELLQLQPVSAHDFLSPESQGGDGARGPRGRYHWGEDLLQEEEKGRAKGVMIQHHHQV